MVNGTITSHLLTDLHNLFINRSLDILQDKFLQAIRSEEMEMLDTTMGGIGFIRLHILPIRAAM
jgi:hypothetical protein